MDTPLTSKRAIKGFFGEREGGGGGVIQGFPLINTSPLSASLFSINKTKKNTVAQKGHLDCVNLFY